MFGANIITEFILRFITFQYGGHRGLTLKELLQRNILIYLPFIPVSIASINETREKGGNFTIPGTESSQSKHHKEPALVNRQWERWKPLLTNKQEPFKHAFCS